MVPDSAQRVAAIESGRVDMVQNNDVKYFEVPRLKKLPKLNFFTKGNEAISPISWMDINLRLPKFQDKRFRKAMMHALDRQFIVDNLYFGLDNVANRPIASSTEYSGDSALVKYPYDPKRAIALMDEMGLKPDAGGVRQRVNVIALPYGEVWTRQAELVKQQFGKVGIAATIESTDATGTLSAKLQHGISSSFYELPEPVHGPGTRRGAHLCQLQHPQGRDLYQCGRILQSGG